MSKDYNYNSEDIQAIEEARRKKVEKFKVHFDTQEFSASDSAFDTYLDGEPDEEKEINSYSGEEVKEQMEQISKKALKLKRKEQKKQEKRKNKKNTRTFRWIWLISVVIVGAVLAVYLLVGINDMLAINRTEDATVNVIIPENPTLDDISQALEKSGVIHEPKFFNMYAILTKSTENFTQGSYNMNVNMDYEAIINYLQSYSNRTDTIKVTIPEGQNIQEIAASLKNAGVLSSEEEFLKLCNSNAFDEDYTFLKDIKNSDKRYYKLEGYLYPDTYEFYVNENPQMTIERFLTNFENQLYSKQSVQGYDKKIRISDQVEKTDYTMDEILTIASIIQAEAASNDDMYYISSVLHNRLNASSDAGVQKLGLDSTKFYPYRSEEYIPADQKSGFKSRYDTYDLIGLPPGPICNPGTQAIEAAINPKDTGYLFFCHSSDGTPYYAATLDEHNYNLSLAGVE